MSNQLPEDLPVANAVDTTILMHREAHFSGDFATMIAYYEQGGKGVSKDFELNRIIELAAIERAMNKNMAPLMLTGADAEKIARARAAYQKLQNIYESDKESNVISRLISDLILSEEEVPNAEIDALVEHRDAAVPALIELIRAEDFYDPLFPGYGLAPLAALHCLEKMGDKRAIMPLFEMIGSSDLFSEEIALFALKKIGKPAKDFLLKIVSSHPITEDNEKAAIALIHFKEDSDVASYCLKTLQNLEFRQAIPLANYLALACEGLTDPDEQADFRLMLDDRSTPDMVKDDIKCICNSWARY